MSLNRLHVRAYRALMALLLCLGIVVAFSPQVGATTPTEQAAASWAQSQTGSTAYQYQCLRFVYQAYISAGMSRGSLDASAGYVANGNTYPIDEWNYWTSGHAPAGVFHQGYDAAPPVGAIIYFSNRLGHDYSHATISLGGGLQISPDTTSVSGPQSVNTNTYRTMLGWWLPEGSSSGGGGGSLADGSFISHNGMVYRMAGGAPLYVSSWDIYGGGQPTTAVDDATFNSLRRYPADGTVISGTGSGYVYKFAGGAPLYVGSWDAIGGSAPATAIDQAAINAAGSGAEPWSHMLKYPADGTFLSDGQAIYRVVGGGTAMWISSCAPTEIGCGAVTRFDNANLVHTNDAEPWGHLRATAVDGSFVRVADGAENGLIARAAGGSFIGLTTCAPAGIDGCSGLVNVNQPSFDGYMKAHPAPASGTIVQGVPSMKSYVYVAGGLCRALGVHGAGGIPISDQSLHCDSAAPTARMIRPGVSTLGSATTITWSGADTGSGIRYYELRYRTASPNGTWSGYQSPWGHLTGTSVSVSGLRRGYEYCYSVRAVDRVDFASPWTADQCTAVAFDDQDLTASAGWSRTPDARSMNRTLTRTTSASVTLTRAGVKLDQVGLVVVRCAGCGIVGVYVGSTLVNKVDLNAAATSYQVVVMLQRFSLRTGTVTVRSLTSGKKVIIDGLIVSQV